jgi:hypothetical protein
LLLLVMQMEASQALVLLLLLVSRLPCRNHQVR